MNQPTTQGTLYDRDFNLWIEDTVTRLKARDFAHLDLENLVEEIDSLGRRDKRELESRLQNGNRPGMKLGRFCQPGSVSLAGLLCAP